MMGERKQPPKWIFSFFHWFCRPEYQEDLEGDLRERFEKRLKTDGIRKAQRALAMDMLRLFRPGLMRPLIHIPSFNPYAMYFNHYKIAWRTLLNNRGFAILNIGGLTLGITCCLLIFSFVNFHNSFDSYHPVNDRIYRFVTEQHLQSVYYEPHITNPFGKVFREEFDLAEYTARLCTQNILVTTAEDHKYHETVAFAEDGYFNIFNLPFVKGSLESAFKSPRSVVLTESLAKKYFGDAAPVGQTLTLNGNIEATVTGVLKDIRANSDFRTQLYISYSTLPQYNTWLASDDSWGGLTDAMQCFVRLRPGVTPKQVEVAIAGYPDRFRPGAHNRHVYKLQSIRDVHFSALYGGVLSKRNLNVLIVIGLFLLLTACFNFINLTTALNARRTKEVGITKVIGGTRGNLFWRFIAETSLIAGSAFIIALFLSWYARNVVNAWLGDNLRFDYIVDEHFLVFLPLLLLFIVFASGSYPGLYMANLFPVAALKGLQTNRGKRYYSLRKILIVGQFCITQVLIIGLIIMVMQMKYAQGDLGFTRDAVVTIPAGSRDEKTKSLKNEILGLAGVEHVSACFATPASNRNNWGTGVWYDTHEHPEPFNIQFKGADTDYLKTFDIDLIAGRNLLPSDTVREFMVNETFLNKMNITSPQEVIGKQLAINSRRLSGTIVGVVRDFYDRSFREERNAICITTSLEDYYVYGVSLSGQNFPETIASIQTLWTRLYPDQLFSYEFLDDQLAEFYETDRVLVSIIRAFAFIAIFIGCLGLLGLISLMAANRKKEIAIRKVFGGSIGNIVSIFSSELLKLILVASLIAVPIGWWAMSKWLENFVYRISPQPWVFAVAIGVTVAVSALTISFRSFKAAIANPVDSLRSNA